MTPNGTKQKTNYSEMLQIIIATITLITSIAALVVSSSSLRIAENSYEYSTANFSFMPSVRKEGNNLIITNEYSDVFKINEISVDGYECWHTEGEINSDMIMFNTLAYNRSVWDDDSPELKQTVIDLNGVCYDAGKSVISIIEEQKFKDAYKVNFANLQTFADMDLYSIRYEIVIEYQNSKTYNSESLDLTVIIDDDGDIDRVTQDKFFTKHCTTFWLAREYDNFNFEWNGVVEYIKSLSEISSDWVPYEE